MQSFEKTIKKIGQFTYFFADMDTIFMDKDSTIIWEYGHNQLPETLHPYVKKMRKQLNQERRNDDDNVLFHTNELRTYYMSAKLHNEEKDFLGILIVGPFLFEKPSPQLVQNVLFENKLPISLRHTMTQYYLSLPLISEYKVDMIAEFLAFHTTNMDKLNNYQPKFAKAANMFQNKFEVIPAPLQEHQEISVGAIEKRYSLQNELMSAVEHGDIVKAEKLLNEDMPLVEKIPNRIPNDPLRSEKNLAFTFNTSLRIAVEKGGLHPLYIHSISEKFAIQIEKTTSIQQLDDLQNVMIREYCEAVRKYSLKNYSFLIRKAIEYIRFHLEQDLSLETICTAIHSSTYELSRKFKKETGQTLTDYINALRINEALYAMENRNLSITDIAYMVGFNDVNYFTKVFKKLKGMTPSSYRKQL
ncbi:helix-turn-helix transcriptional regulator [Bacillus benzoevorans]|uniref:AraC-like DNA-binding protein n=1 Tax=Bacillus benzoevorans TaxID=1456 RepID=A0A7X0HQH4_9BACI|nr:AraC family transcriptional regulator [Bacillus benzoevorans]MBB6445054.1 AraC-like DNA-binding protein [Bacillus benzoevorans]